MPATSLLANLEHGARSYPNKAALVFLDHVVCYESFTDRLKRMINTSGFNVWPAEIEALMYRRPAIQEVCLIGTQGTYCGENVLAFVVLRPGPRSLGLLD